MGDFFQGWRRKIGVATLVMACVFTAGWVRSHVLGEDVEFSIGQHTTHGFGWIGQWLIWGSIYDENAVYSWPVFSFESNVASDSPLIGPDRVWHWRSCGFGRCELKAESNGGCRLVFRVIPFWSIVVPLTLLSAWLLLSKPPVSKPKSTADAVAVEGH